MIYFKFKKIIPKFSHICAIFTFIILWELFLRSNFVALLSYLNLNYDKYGKFEIPSHGIEEFRKLDINENKQLSLNEWLPYYYQCHNDIKIKVAHNYHNSNYNFISKSIGQKEESASEDKKSILLHSYFSALKLESSLKDYINEHQKNPSLFGGLLNWTEPFIKEREFLIQDFREFLPPSKVACGETWWIIPPIATETNEQASSFVYTPQNPSLFLEKLFQMFHPRPFLLTRFKPQGILAALKAKNDDIMQIIFRAHVEFQLEEPPNFPFWFTPSQFKGSLIINKKISKIYSFEMEVPTNRNLNIDMEWLYGINEKEDSEVNLGFLPIMKINFTSSVKGLQKPGYNTQNEFKNEDIVWSCLEKASWDNIEKTMYPFKKVPYYNITEAFRLAKMENKLIHSIILWGSLDDQSC